MPEEKNNLRSRFFTHPVEGDVVEVKIAGDPFNSSSIQKVTPEHLRLFPREWEAFTRGRPVVDHGGTPLTRVPGFHENMTTAFALAGIHNAEQLATIPDGNLIALGLGGRGLRDAAANMLDNKAKDDEIAKLKAQIADGDKGKPKQDAPKGDNLKGEADAKAAKAA